MTSESTFHCLNTPIPPPPRSWITGVDCPAQLTEIRLNYTILRNKLHISTPKHVRMAVRDDVVRV